MVELQAGALVCHVEPQLGGCIAGLWLDGVPVLRSAPASQLGAAGGLLCARAVFQSHRPNPPAVAGHTLSVTNQSRQPAPAGLGWQPFFMKRTTPAQGGLAIEPVSHVNNALALVAQGAGAALLGLVTLAPGESLEADMTIEVRRA